MPDHSTMFLHDPSSLGSFAPRAISPQPCRDDIALKRDILSVNYCTAGVCSGVERACCADRRRAMVRLAEASSRTNNQPATMATPASEIHMIQRATIGFELLVNTCANPAR